MTPEEFEAIREHLKQTGTHPQVIRQDAKTLLDEVERLRAALVDYADHNNWIVAIGDDGAEWGTWDGDYQEEPWLIAERALCCEPRG